MRISVTPPIKNISTFKILCLTLLLSSVFIISPKFVDSAEVAPKTYTVPAGCIHYVYEIEKYNWDTSMVIRIAKLESGCNRLAVNMKDNHRTCIGSFNILQVGCLHYKKGQDRKDAFLNIKLAYDLYEKRNGSFKDWSTCKKIKGCS